MAEQGSDSANTGASGAELVRQLLDRTTLRARKEGALAKPGLLAARRRDRAWAIVVGTSGRSGGKTGRLYDRARDVRLPAVRCQLTTEEVRQ